jgi:hypothetical protein
MPAHKIKEGSIKQQGTTSIATSWASAVPLETGAAASGADATAACIAESFRLYSQHAALLQQVK